MIELSVLSQARKYFINYVLSHFQPEADEGEGVGAEDVDLPLQRQDVREGPRGPLPQDVRAPRQRGGAGPRHGALQLLDGFVVAGHSWSHNRRPGHRLGYIHSEREKRRRLHKYFSPHSDPLIQFRFPPIDVLVIYKDCICVCVHFS